MPAKKAAAPAEAEVKAVPANQPSKLEDVVPEIQRLRNEGLTVPEICDRLDVSYSVVNQIVQQSYKMAMDTPGVFERQEQIRLGLIEV